MNLPQDLKKQVRRAVWQKSRVCLAWEAALVLLIIFFGETVFPTKYVEMKIIGYILVLALPFIFTKFPFNLIDETYCGTIERVEIKTATDNAYLDTPMPTGLKLYSVNTVYLYIKTPQGDMVRKRVYKGRSALKQYVDTYHAGDKVFHLYGTDTVVVLPTGADEHVVCAVCGVVNEKENDACRECGHTLIKDLGAAEE